MVNITKLALKWHRCDGFNNENNKLQLFGEIEHCQRRSEPKFLDQNAFDCSVHQTDLDDKSTDFTCDGNDFSNKPYD